MVQQSFASRAYRDDAVVLRTHKLGEADRIITLLTKHHGQVRAVGGFILIFGLTLLWAVKH